MTKDTPILHMLCGKIAAGKSTLAAELAQAPDAVLLAEDSWLAALYHDQMSTPRDYQRCADRFRAAIGPHVETLLRAGLSVVLDFQANTVASRAWMRDLATAAGASHQLHVLMPSDAICLARLRDRNASGTHPFTVTDEQFHAVSAHFVPPSPQEGFTIIRHD